MAAVMQDRELERQRALAMARARMRSQQQQTGRQSSTRPSASQGGENASAWRTYLDQQNRINAPQNVSRPDYDEMLSRTAEMRAQSGEMPPRISRGEAFARGAADIFAAGFADNISGRVANLQNRAQRISSVYGGSDAPAETPDQAGARVANRVRAQQSSAQEDRPASFVGGQIAGGLAQGAGVLGLVGKAGQAAAASRPLLASAATGALEGGAYGAGSADDGSRTQGALTGAAWGAALGPAFTAGAQALRPAGRAINRMITGQPQAAPGIRRAMSGVADDALQDAGDGAFLGERIGPQGEELLTSLSQRSDNAGSIVREAARRRSADRAQRVMAEVQMRTGSQRGVDAIADVAQAEEAAKPLFNRADGQRVRVSRRMRDALARLREGGYNFREASQTARLQGRAQGLGDLEFSRSQINPADVESLVQQMRQVQRGGPRLGPRLSQFVRSAGGIADDGGDLASYGRSVIRKGGRSADDLALAAWEDGYFPAGADRPSANEFLDLLRRDLDGDEVYAQADFDALAQIDELDGVRSSLQRMGLDVDERNVNAMRDQARRFLEQSDAPFEALQEVPLGDVRQLARQIESDATSLLTAQGGNRQRGIALAQLARQLRDEMKESSPEFARASGLWRDEQLNRRAFDIGTQVFDEGRKRAQIEADLRDFIGSDMSAAERGQFFAGVLDAIERKTSSTPTTGNPASRLTRQGIHERLSIVFGANDADALADVLERQNQLARMDNVLQPDMNSATAIRQRSQGAEDRLAAGPVRGGASDVLGRAADVARQPVTTAENVFQSLIRGGMDARQAEELARLLTMQGNAASSPLVQSARQPVTPYALPAGAMGGLFGGQVSQKRKAQR